MHDILWGDVPSGFINFAACSGTSGAWHDVGAAPVSQLRDSDAQPWLPWLLDRLERDAYASISSMYKRGYKTHQRHEYRPATIEGQRVQVETLITTRQVTVPGSGGLFYPYRRADAAQWLGWVWADCDGRMATIPTDGPGSLANVTRAYQDSLIPVPSLIVLSGRGAWPCWKIVDDRNPAEGTALIGKTVHTPTTACKSSSQALALHHAINVAIAARLRDIGADPQSVDAARMMRVFGSENTKSGTRVAVMPLLINGRPMAVYTLGELAAELGVSFGQRGRPPKPIGRITSEAQRAQRRDAAIVRHRKVWDALQALSRMRGGFGAGIRNSALHYMALHGYRAGLDAATVAATVSREASMSEGYGTSAGISPQQVQSILRSAERAARKPQYPPSYDTIVNTLDITSHERTAIGLVARSRGPRRRDAQQADRAGLIHAIRAREGYTGTDAPPTRRMAQLLTEAGHHVGHDAVARTYRALGLVSGGRDARNRLPLAPPPGPPKSRTPWLES